VNFFMEALTIKNEMVRKCIHLALILIPLGYTFLAKKTMLILLGSAILIAAAVELTRSLWPGFSRLFYRLTGKLLREHERSGLTGATYFFIGSFVTILFFEKWIALVALFFVVVSDGLGAMVGRLVGKHHLYSDKSIEGCLVFIGTAVAALFMVSGVTIPIGIAGAVSAFLIDVFVKGIDDNFAIPLGSGMVMQILFWIDKSSLN